jgi:hypothetical protein
MISPNLPVESRPGGVKKPANRQGDNKVSRGSARKGKVHDGLNLVKRNDKGWAIKYIHSRPSDQRICRIKNNSYWGASRYAMKKKHTPDPLSLRWPLRRWFKLVYYDAEMERRNKNQNRLLQGPPWWRDVSLNKKFNIDLPWTRVGTCSFHQLGIYE